MITTGPTEGGNFSFLALRKAKLSGERKKAGKKVIIVRWEKFLFSSLNYLAHLQARQRVFAAKNRFLACFY